MRLSPEQTQTWLSQKTLPYFKLYLAERKKEDHSVLWQTLCVTAPLFVVPGVLYLMGRSHSWLGFVAFLVPAFAAVGGALAVRANYLKSRHHPIRQYLNLFEARGSEQIHRFIDATAQELLEAGSFFWYKIHSLLGTNHPSARIASIRDDAIRAADDAMDELMVLCSSCIGDPVNKRGDDIKGALSGLVEGNIKGAMRDFAEVLNPDSARYRVRSPHIDVVYMPARSLAEKLQTLSTEIERLSTEAMTAQHAQTGAVSSIDSVLYAIQATRVAEQELETAEQQQFNRPN